MLGDERKAMRMKRLRFLMLFGLASVACAGGAIEPPPPLEPPTPDPEPPTCENALTEVAAELEAIQSCVTNAECGQPLPGTSCGCTRNLVATADADPSAFYELREEAAELGCLVGGISTCDCPQADGFVCDDGRCTWNYL